MTLFDGLMKIRFIQLKDSCKICIGSIISCFIRYKNVSEHSSAPSGVEASLVEQLHDLLGWPALCSLYSEYTNQTIVIGCYG